MIVPIRFLIERSLPNQAWKKDTFTENRDTPESAANSREEGRQEELLLKVAETNSSRIWR